MKIKVCKGPKCKFEFGFNVAVVCKNVVDTKNYFLHYVLLSIILRLLSRCPNSIFWHSFKIDILTPEEVCAKLYCICHSKCLA